MDLHSKKDLLSLISSYVYFVYIHITFTLSKNSVITDIS
jgi:hypothetical protein